MTQLIPGTFIGSSAHFSITIVSGSSNNPGTPAFADLQMTNDSTVQVTASGMHTLTIELTATGFTSPSGTPLSLSSSAGGEVRTANSDTVTATYEGVLDPTNTPFGNGQGVPLGAPPSPDPAQSSGVVTATASGLEVPLVFTPGTALNLVPSATPFSLTDVSTFTFSSASSGDYINMGATTAASPPPTMTTSQQPASAAVGSSIADKATVTGGQPDRHRDVHPVQQPQRHGHAAVHQPRGRAGGRHGHLAGLHGHGDGHRLLGGQLQRRRQQRAGQQRHRRRAGDHQTAIPTITPRSSRPAPRWARRSPTRRPSAAATTRPAP